MLAYLLVAIAAIGALGGLYYRVHHDGYEQGKNEVQTAWDKANEAARLEMETQRKALEAARAKQELALSRRLTNERKRATDLQTALDEALRGSPDCKLPDGVRDIWNKSHQAGEGKPSGGVPEGSRKPAPSN